MSIKKHSLNPSTELTIGSALKLVMVNAIIGPAGTGKSYLLQALIKQMRSQCLVVCKLAPSGVAAHLIGGTTIHNFFCLDLEYNSSL